MFLIFNARVVTFSAVGVYCGLIKEMDCALIIIIYRGQNNGQVFYSRKFLPQKRVLIDLWYDKRRDVC